MRIAINAGHTKNGPGYGAIGYLKESKETRRVVNELLVLFRRKGHEAINCTVDHAVSQYDYLNQVVKLANKSNAELFLSIHFNTGGGKGSEAYTWQGKKLKYAENICNNLHNLSFTKRGIKDGSKFAVIKNTKMTSILIEVCFLDNKSDVDLYTNLGAKKIAEVIYEAIVN